jgi:hypothetical protein
MNTKQNTDKFSNPRYLNNFKSFSLIYMQDLGSNLVDYRAISLENIENRV